jgi:hypothetical protein
MDVRVSKGKALTTTAPSRPVARPLFSFTPAPRGESCLFLQSVSDRKLVNLTAGRQ